MKRLLFATTLFICSIAVPILAQDSTFIPGQSYFGRNNYIEYIAGNSPYVVSAPHGGSLTPSEIPDRTSGETVTDSNVRELARAISDAIFAREGKYPHIILCHLRRTKLDANRDLNEATQGGNPYAVQAWKEFQSFIDTAEQTVVREFGKGFYVDLHGHGQEPQRLQLGYLLSSSALALSNTSLDNGSYGALSSIRTLIPMSQLSFSQLLRGPQSLGSYFENRSYPAVPSEKQPNPGTGTYFSGGYNTQRHGSLGGGTVSGVQIECNMIGVRDTDSSRKKFAAAFAEVINTYAALHIFHVPVAVSESDRESGLPVQFALSQNYPNPFNPSTTITYQLPAKSFVVLRVYDLLGQVVATLVQREEQAGRHLVIFDASGVPSGVYFYRLQAGNFIGAKKLVILK